MKDTTYHPDWQKNRIDFILNFYSPDFFKNKKILELGSCNGYIGNYFAEVLKSDVTSVEGREENVNKIKGDYPLLKVECFNLDTDEWNFGKYDVIINFGLFYHLEKHHEKHLTNCINNCDLMFFESVIYDSYDPEIFFRNEIGFDQSLTDIGGTPSASFVENIFTKTNCKYERYEDQKLNGGCHHYDWEIKNSKQLDQYARKFWIVETSIKN